MLDVKNIFAVLPVGLTTVDKLEVFLHRLFNITEIDKSKVAAAKLEVLISQLLYKKATKFQRLTPTFSRSANTPEL